MSAMLSNAIFTFFACFVIVPVLAAIARLMGIYTIVNEGKYYVYVLFGNVLGTISEPGFHFLPALLGWRSCLVNWLGRCYVLDMRLDQKYIRSAPVNSEEGAPMGIGIWYEMYISDPVAYLFKNADPQGSLAANVSNATVRCLSNMPLGEMLENRHKMSQVVRDEVSIQSQEWGYKVGSIYIRKVHFRDVGMIRQIEEKVVNRLRQVTSAIKQNGANQVNIIASTAEREAAIEFGRAQATHPQIVGEALRQISVDPDVADAMFDILECEKLIDGGAQITLIPKNSGMLADIVAATEAGAGKNDTQATNLRSK